MHAEHTDKQQARERDSGKKHLKKKKERYFDKDSHISPDFIPGLTQGSTNRLKCLQISRQNEQTTEKRPETKGENNIIFHTNNAQYSSRLHLLKI